jgi:hypothetical protein
MAEPPQLLSPTIESNQTDALGHCPWCWDEAAPCKLGGTGPQTTQSAIAQLIVVCKKIDLICLAEPPQLFAPPLIPIKLTRWGLAHGVGMKRRHADWGALGHRQCNQQEPLAIMVC